ncbi:hypothetical protein TYRP_006151 [Tyrophagus putrescentiae]|nr:hypothetical protein TYRP_006151 [Tyrophagus putrescentiae]
MESGNDGAGVGLFVWIKSMANVIVGAAAAVAGGGGGGGAEGDNCGGGGDSCASSYHTLPSCPAAVLGDNEVEKTSKTKTKQIISISGADRNNNSAAERAKQANGSAVSTSHRSSNGKMSGGKNFQRLRDDDESGSSSSSSSFSFNEEGEKVIHKPHHHHPQPSQSKHIPQTRAKLISENDDDSTTTTLPCCDIMKTKHQLCGNGSFRRTSPKTAENGGVALQNGSNVVNGSSTIATSTTTKIPSNKIIEAIIEVIKKGELIRKFDPLVETKTANFHISPLVTTCMRNYTFTGLSNIEKADSEGIIRYLGPNQYSLDCVLLLRDLVFQAHYCIKLGGRWHRRPCLRNKTLTVALAQATVYVELKFNTAKRTVRFERFSPISQRGVRVKTRPFGVASANALFAKRQARRCLDRSALLTYEDIVARTALNTLFECFPRPVATTTAGTTSLATTTSTSTTSAITTSV